MLRPPFPSSGVPPHTGECLDSRRWLELEAMRVEGEGLLLLGWTG